MRTKSLYAPAVVLLLALGAFFFIVPTQVDRSMNTIVMTCPLPSYQLN
jgi:hypothetical protein